jgi:hypothetical protein
MNFSSVLRAFALTALVAQSSAWAAAAGEQWTAYSKTAVAITGNITFSSDRVTFGDGKSLPLAPAGAVPDFLTLWGKRNASLFRVTAPDDPVLLHGARLCGNRPPQPVTFIAISILPPDVGTLDLRAMDVFSGAEPPKGVEDTHFCANFNFELAATPDGISTPAAIDPAYVGVWAPYPGACRADDRTAFRLRPKGISGREFECQLEQASSDRAGWLVRLSCAAEGNEYTLNLRWQLTPNGRLRETQKGQSTEYVRCRDSAYR